MVDTMQTPLLQVQQLNKSFDLHLIDGRTIHPVKEMSFTVMPRQHFLIWGRSGVGKTSVLKCIYRTYLSTSGHILYDSEHAGIIDMTTIPERTVLALREQEIGYCSQFLKVLPRVSALDVISEPLRRTGMDVKHAHELAMRWLTKLQIAPHLWQASPVTFSGGEQQRINLGRAFITAPRLLLLDEPTASLDIHSKQIVIDLIRDALAKNTTIVTVSHDIDTLSSVADQQLAL